MLHHVGLSRPTPPQRGESAVCSVQLRSLRGPRAAVSLIRMACLVTLVASGGVGCRPGYQNVSPVTGRLDAFVWGMPVEQLTQTVDGEPPPRRRPRRRLERR